MNSSKRKSKNEQRRDRRNWMKNMKNRSENKVLNACSRNGKKIKVPDHHQHVPPYQH